MASVLLHKIDPATNARKFWSAEIIPPAVVLLRWGRIDTKGQGKEFDCITIRQAEVFLRDRVSEKLSEGYRKLFDQVDGAMRDSVKAAKATAEAMRTISSSAVWRSAGPNEHEHEWRDATMIGDRFRTRRCVRCGADERLALERFEFDDDYLRAPWAAQSPPKPSTPKLPAKPAPSTLLPVKAKRKITFD